MEHKIETSSPILNNRNKKFTKGREKVAEQSQDYFRCFHQGRFTAELQWKLAITALRFTAVNRPPSKSCKNCGPILMSTY